MSFYFQIHKFPYTVTLFTIFTIVEYSFFCYFYYLILPTTRSRKFVSVVWSGFILFAFIDYFFLSESDSFDSVAIGIESIIILLLCIYYLYLQIKGSNNLKIYSTFNFWIIITFLIYFSGTFFLYIMTENMTHNISFQIQYLVINSCFSILKNILLSVAMFMKINNVNSNNLTSSPDLDEDIFFQQNK